MDSSPATSQLTLLQQQLLRAFFDREDRFFLTGGGALAGFHLRHRSSEDLDLFTSKSLDFEEVERLLEASTSECGATLRPIRRFPEYRRYIVERGEERTIVDLVLDRAPQVHEKLQIGRIRVDTLEEIAANKLCALLSRNEPKDLVDLKAILESGIRLDDALRDAAFKDGGANPANIAFVLDQWTIGSAAKLPGGGSPVELDRFRRDLVAKLAALAFPKA